MLVYSRVSLKGQQMAAHDQQQSFPNVEPNALHVGEGVCVKGDISVPGILVVDGQVEGSINARAVWVSPTGSIKGAVAATEAEVYGAVSETIVVKQLLVVHAGGRLTGDVRYGELQLEKGAVISGTLACVSDSKEAAIEPVLGKSERPKVLRRIEAQRPLNGGNSQPNSSGPHAGLPPADYRVAS
jgi:cytoskeletal protein CcmA (bactofilin family)